jgi:hypothetical protein
MQAHQVPTAEKIRIGTQEVEPDYADSFEVAQDAGDSRSPEQWARALFEGAPPVLRTFLPVGWRGALGFRLGPRPSDLHVLGWRVAETSTDTIRLELWSPLMTGQLVLRVRESSTTVTTVVAYRRWAARVLWGAIAPIHRQLMPYLLGRARHA